MLATKRTTVLGVVAALVLAAAAYAYFTSTGSGTGRGAVGSASPWTVTPSASTGGPLLPGSGTANIAYGVTNSSPGHQRLGAMTALVASNAAGNILQGGVAVPGCLAAWFTAAVHQPTSPALPADLGGGASATGGSVDVTMQNVASSQNACQARSPDITISADAPPSGAPTHVFWNRANAIGRANLDGSAVNLNFITGVGTSQFLAVDGAHVYWSNTSAGTIGRANMDGSNINQSFITGATNPWGVAVDGGHVYWSNNTSAGSIGRANLDGTGVNQRFISETYFPKAVAVDGSNVYWGTAYGSIGRANLDGSAANQLFILGASGLAGVAVDGTAIYWANSNTGKIGRANLDGSGANQSFVTGASGSGPTGVAADGAHVYWGNTSASPSTIGRANPDGSGVNQSFIAGVGVIGVAVGP